MTSPNGSFFRVTGPLCAGNELATGEFPSQRPVARGFDVFFDLRLNKRLRKYTKRQWFETPSRSLWRHYNADWSDPSRQICLSNIVNIAQCLCALWFIRKLTEYGIRPGDRLQWHHDEHDGVSNHQRLECLLNRLFRCRLKKTSKLRVTGLCEGNHR